MIFKSSYYLKKFFDYPVRLKWQTLQNLGFFRTLKVGFSYLRSLLLKRPEDSLENFYINRFGKTLYSMFFEDYTAKVWGRHPKEISADWGAQRVKGLSIVAMLKDIARKAWGHSDNAQTETSLIEQFWYPKMCIRDSPYTIAITPACPIAPRHFPSQDSCLPVLH